MIMMIRKSITLSKQDWEVLDELAAAAKETALWGENGYRPAVLRALLDAYRRSGKSAAEFLQCLHGDTQYSRR